MASCRMTSKRTEFSSLRQAAWRSNARRLKTLLKSTNVSCARKRGVVFEPGGWEFALPGMGRPQSLINEGVRSCDYFLMVLHDRWGQPTEAGETPKFKSGTHEEYCVAIACYGNAEAPMRQLVLLFKGVDSGKLADPGPQLHQVLEFRRDIEREKKILSSTFDEPSLFQNLVRVQLDQWLLDHEHGRGGSKAEPQAPPTPPPPDSAVNRIPNEPESSTPAATKLVEEAERMANEGRLVDAETKFAQAVVTGNDTVAFSRYGNFLLRVGRLDQAAIMYRRVVELGELANEVTWRAVGYGNLGLIYQTRGELDRAEEMLKKSLAINEELGRKEGMANQYSNPGGLHRDRGDKSKAREYWTQSRDLFAEIGMPHMAEKVQGWIDELQDAVD